MTTKRTIAINERGHRIGEDRAGAKLTNHEVELLLAMREAEGLGYGQLAALFEISKSSARDLIKGRRRNQTPAGWKVIEA